ncbi:MAG: hypothetical protein LC775_20410, partial [Acidobacteria bacterium]|nr:hypothetical protein [Acidobacteriota bacterium]
DYRSNIRVFTPPWDGRPQLAFATAITSEPEISASRDYNQPVQTYAPGSKGAKLFARLTDEVLCRIASSHSYLTDGAKLRGA